MRSIEQCPAHNNGLREHLAVFGDVLMVRTQGGGVSVRRCYKSSTGRGSL